MTGRYGLAIMRAIRMAGAATVLAIVGFIVVMVRREREPRTRNREPRTRNPEPGTRTLNPEPLNPEPRS
jgi:hypothetical protein